MTIESEAVFRTGVGALSGTVSIVTTGSASGPAGWRGMTATAVCSLSADPASLVTCLNRSSGTYWQIQTYGVFAVNVLMAWHVGLARTFAGKEGLVGPDRFDPGAWIAGDSDVPVLVDARAAFECRLSRSLEHGTHALLIGDIQHVRCTECEVRPLMYHNYRFRDLGHDIDTEMIGGSHHDQ